MRFIIGLLLALSLSLTGASYNLPNLNSAGQNTLSSVMEELIGQQFYGYILSTSPVVEDYFVNQYMDQLGSRLLAASPKPQQQLTFFVIKDGTVNAFAGPGGYIGLNTGTLMTARTEGELASVMAHEMAHVMQRHIARGIEEAKRDQLLGLGSILAGLATGGAGIAAAGASASFERGMRTSRAFEQEADRVGLQILQRAGFSRKDMANFLAQMNRDERQTPVDDIIENFSSHPLSSRRYAEAALKSDHDKASKASLQYQLIQARALADTTDDPKKTARELKQKSLNTLPAQYAYALCLLKAREYNDAIGRLKTINAQHPENSLLEASLARAYMKAGQSSKALALIKETHYYEPENTALTLTYADLLISAKHYKQAAQVLESQHEGTSSLAYLDLLAHAQGHGGEKKAAFVTRAKLYAKVGQLAQAIMQLGRAQSFQKPVGLNLEIKRLKQDYQQKRSLMAA